MFSVPYEDLQTLNAPFATELKQAANTVIDNGWYILGHELTRFEQEFAQYVGVTRCIGVANGLEALRLGLTVLDLPAGSEVLVAANAYIACHLSILQAGFVPKFVEPDPQTLQIDTDAMRASITTKTRAIMAVHMYGNVCDMADISAVAKQYGLKIIEDCAQAHGARCQGKKVGTFGEVAAFSFYPTKNLGALGDAGAVVTNDAYYAEKLKKLRNYGFDIPYHAEYLGCNSRLDEMQAAFLSIKLKHLDAINAHKRQLAKRYDQGLRAEIKRLLPTLDSEPVYHIYPIQVETRDLLQAKLSAVGIGTKVHYPYPPHQQPALKQYGGGLELPVSEALHQRILSLPISAIHTNEQIDYVIHHLNELIV